MSACAPLPVPGTKGRYAAPISPPEVKSPNFKNGSIASFVTALGNSATFVGMAVLRFSGPAMRL